MNNVINYLKKSKSRHSAADLPGIAARGIMTPDLVSQIMDEIIAHDQTEGFLERTWLTYSGDDVLIILPDWEMSDESGGDWLQKDVIAESWSIGDSMSDQASDALRDEMVEWVSDWSAGTVWWSVRGWRHALVIQPDGEMRWDCEVDEYAADVELAPPEPDCVGDGEHVWEAPYSIVGGIKENPGVSGHGGGVIIDEICRYCGAQRNTNTWAQGPGGAQGYRSVAYTETNDEVLRLLEQTAQLWGIDLECHWDDLERDDDDRMHLPGLIVRRGGGDGGKAEHYPLDTVDSIADNYCDCRTENNPPPESILVCEAWLEWSDRDDRWELHEGADTTISLGSDR